VITGVPETGAGAPTLSRRYTSEHLLARANAWAARHGYQTITPATLHELCKDGLLEGPRQRGRGQGRGSAWDWSARDYRRLLQLIALRGHGIRRRDQQRVALFVRGTQLPPGTVRPALLRLQQASSRRMHRQLRSDFWPAGRVPPAVQQMAREILDIGSADALFARLGPARQEAAAQASAELLAHPGVNRFMSLVLDAWLRGPDGAASCTSLRGAVALLPDELQGLGAEISEMVLIGAGLLGPCDTAAALDNAVVDALSVLDDEDLVAVRDFMLGWDGLCRGAVALLDSVPEDQLNPTLTHIRGAMRTMAPAVRAVTLEERLALMGVLLVMTARQPNFGRFIRGCVDWRIGPLFLELGRRGLLSRPDGPTEAEVDEVLAAVGVPAEIRQLPGQPG
jgi:hypothetical protein